MGRHHSLLKSLRRSAYMRLSSKDYRLQWKLSKFQVVFSQWKSFLKRFNIKENQQSEIFFFFLKKAIQKELLLLSVSLPIGQTLLCARQHHTTQTFVARHKRGSSGSNLEKWFTYHAAQWRQSRTGHIFCIRTSKIAWLR